MFNHVRIIKQLFVTSDGNRRNLITHAGVISRLRARTRDRANARFNREEIIAKLSLAAR